MEIACCSTTSPSPTPLLRKRSNLMTPRASLSFAAAPWGMVPRGMSVARPRRTARSLGLECKCLFGLGVPEMVVIAGVAALVFGPKQLPEIGRNIGKTVKGFQQAAKEFETELKTEPKENGAPPAEKPQAVAGGEPKKELETSSTKESA